MVLGHFPAAYVGWRALGVSRAPSTVLVFVLAYLPDILDKSPSFFFGLPSSGYAHSVFSGVAAGLLVCACAWGVGARRPVRAGFLALFFYLLHLSLDDLDLRTLLWPLRLRQVLVFQPAPIGYQFDLAESLRHFYILHDQPVLLGLEAVFFSLMLAYVVRDRLAAGRAGRA